MFSVCVFSVCVFSVCVFSLCFLSVFALGCYMMLDVMVTQKKMPRRRMHAQMISFFLECIHMYAGCHFVLLAQTKVGFLSGGGSRHMKEISEKEVFCSARRSLCPCNSCTYTSPKAVHHLANPALHYRIEKVNISDPLFRTRFEERYKEDVCLTLLPLANS